MLLCPAQNCAKCPRLVEFRTQNQNKFPSYHNAPVESFGSLDAEILVEQLSLQHFTEASAKAGTNVDKTFVEIVKYLYKECYLKGKSMTKKFKMGLEKKEFDDTKVKKKKCC